MPNFLSRTFSLIKRTDSQSLSEGFVSYKVHKKLNTKPNSKGVVSTSLFGDVDKLEFEQKYLQPLIKNCKIISKVLPGWCFRVYVPRNFSSKIIEILTRCCCEVYVMEIIPTGTIGTLWRFLPASENKPFISHDADMLLTESSLAIKDLSDSVYKWLKSDKIFFQRTLAIINYMVPISAGMWGAKPTKEGFSAIPDMQERLEKYNSDWFGCDEAFLTKEVYPLFKSKGVFKVRNAIEILFGILIVILILLLIIKISLVIKDRFLKKINI